MTQPHVPAVEPNATAGDVVVYRSGASLRAAHDHATCSEIARRLAALKRFRFAGEHDGRPPSAQDYSAARRNRYFVPTDTLPAVRSDTVRLEVTSHLKLWQTSVLRPQSIIISLQPEAATFTRAVFFSTRSQAAGGGSVAPRLRLTPRRRRMNRPAGHSGSGPAAGWKMARRTKKPLCAN